MVIKDKLQLANDRELFMSFGLLNDLATIIRDPSNIGLVDLDPDYRNATVEALFATRNKMGRKIGDTEDLDVPYEDIEKALDWAKEHIMGFFVRRLESTAKVVEAHKAKLQKLESSLNGSDEPLSAT